MPPRKDTPPVAPSELDFPSSAERQRHVEQLLKLSPGELSPEKCARRQQALDAQNLRSLRQTYHASGIDTFEHPAVTRKVKGEKE